MALTKTQRRARIHKRIRRTVTGNAAKPRLSVFRSNKEIYAQLIDDLNGKTLGSATSLGDKSAHGGSKTDQAAVIGKKIAEVAKSAKIDTVVFDRGGYLYHGRVKALADAARENGLKF